MPLAAEDLAAIAGRLLEIAGVYGVLLGGSRARGDHTAGFDTDLGVYYRPPLDTVALGELARELAGPAAQVSEPGGWGPWVDGGGWLTIGGGAVDWIYRDLDRVQATWTAPSGSERRAGRGTVGSRLPARRGRQGRRTRRPSSPRVPMASSPNRTWLAPGNGPASWSPRFASAAWLASLTAP